LTLIVTIQIVLMGLTETIPSCHLFKCQLLMATIQ